MKIWLTVGLAILLGVGAGVSTAFLRINRHRWVPPSSGGVSAGAGRMSPKNNPAVRQPKLVVDHEIYKFGVMHTTEKGSHDFIFTNAGTAPLKLYKGDSSCNCAVSKLEKSEVLPGESAKVTVKWEAKKKDYFGQYQETANVLTNDPNWLQVELSIKGKFTPGVRAVPDELALNSVPASETVTTTLKLFGYLPEPVEITGYELADPSTAEHFEVTFQPLASDQVEEEEDATSGHLVQVLVEPGLPPGPFQQRIVLRTNLKDYPTVVVPVKGVVTGEILIVGPGWDDETGVLMLGSVSSREGAKRKLLIIARGPHSKEVEYKVEERVPEMLRVDEEALRRPTQVKGGDVTQAPLIITIPPGSPPANYLGPKRSDLGRITIETNHPQIPYLDVLVRFAVEG